MKFSAVGERVERFLSYLLPTEEGLVLLAGGEEFSPLLARLREGGGSRERDTVILFTLLALAWGGRSAEEAAAWVSGELGEDREFLLGWLLRDGEKWVDLLLGHCEVETIWDLLAEGLYFEVLALCAELAEFFAESRE